MTSLAVASDPLVFSTALEEDLALDEKYAMTIPFSGDRAGCECTGESMWEESMGCKDCAPISALSKLKAEAIKQAKKRWSWFSGARKLDDELSTRLGTLGYLHWEIRVKIFRHVLEAYIEEALTYQTYESGFRKKGFYPSPLEWRAMKDNFKERFEIEISDCHHSKLYNIFSLHSHNADYVEPAFLMPLRLATVDTKFEFDHVFLSTMTFRFSCQKALRQFLKELSPTQLSQVRSVTIEIFGCYDCMLEGIDWRYKSWESVCGQLPSTLDSIEFEIGHQGEPWEWPRSTDDFNLSLVLARGHPDYNKRAKRAKHAKELLEFLSCKVRHIALEAEVTMTRRHDNEAKRWDMLVAVVGETDKWSEEYVKWKKGLGSEELGHS